MFLTQPKSYLGVDIGAGGIKIVELKLEKKRPVLFTYGLTSEAQDIHDLFLTTETLTLGSAKQSAPSPLGTVNHPAALPRTLDQRKIEEYSSLVRFVCKAAKTMSRTAVVSLPVSAVFHAVVNLPPVKKDELDKIVKAELKKLLPRPLEEMVIDYQTLPVVAEGKTTQRVLVNAVPKILVEFYTQVFQRAGLKLESLEPESVALERTLVGKDKSVAMIIDIGAERTNFFIIDQEAAVTHNSIEAGGGRVNKILAHQLGLDEEQAERVKYDLSDQLAVVEKGSENTLFRQTMLDMSSSLVEPIKKEIEYSFEVYLRQSGNESKHPEKIILTGGGSLLPGLAEAIAEQFKIKCYVGDPWGRVVYQDGLKPILRQLGPRLSVAVGLALRNLV